MPMIEWSYFLAPVLVALTMMTTSEVHAALQEPNAPTDLPHVKGVSIRGDKLSDWGEQGLVWTVFAGDKAELKPYDRFGATARLGWDDEGLLVQVRVTDPTPLEAPDEDHLYEGDSVELMLKGADSALGMIQIAVSPGTGSKPQRRSHIFDYRSAELKQRALAKATAYAERTATGYVVDIHLPWSNIGGKPADGVAISARIGVNDGVPGQERTRLIGMTTGMRYDFFTLPVIRLAEKAGKQPAAVAWSEYEDFKTARVNVVADKSLVGSPVVVEGSRRVEGVLRADGERASVSLSFPAAAVGKRDSDVTVRLGDKVLDTLAMPDIEARRRSLFQAGIQGGGRGNSPAWAAPAFASTVFTGGKFPTFGYSEPARIKELVGDFQTKVDFYDHAGKKVETATAPGRYGAVVTIIVPGIEPQVTYRTLFRRPDGKEAASTNAIQSAALFEGKAADDADKADRDWWHALRKTLGTAIRYEYFVRLPKGYDADPAKRWPVIYYLHGSGGGERIEDVQNGAIQGPAQKDPNFPFIAVSLRSPGGWYPPAVKDVMDEVEGKYRIDREHSYLTGFSMGGMGTWSVAFDQPTRFAAIAPVGGRRGQPERAAMLKGTSVWVFNGADDSTTTPADAKIAVEALKKAGVDVMYTEIPNAGHVDSHDKTYSGTEIYQWFLRHTRKQAH